MGGGMGCCFCLSWTCHNVLVPWIKYVYLREYDHILLVYLILFISGWWLVANSRGEHGFAPATFLEPVDLGQRSEEEEWREVEEDDRKFLSVRACVVLRAPFFSFLSSYAHFLSRFSLASRLPSPVFHSSCLIFPLSCASRRPPLSHCFSFTSLAHALLVFPTASLLNARNADYNVPS